MNNLLCRAFAVLIACAPYDALARGGSESGFKLMLALGAILLIGWLLAQVPADTWRALGGLFVMGMGATFLYQMITYLFF